MRRTTRPNWARSGAPRKPSRPCGKREREATRRLLRIGAPSAQVRP